MISCHSNYFQVVINMSQVPVDLSPPPREIGGEIAQLIPFSFSNKRSKKIRATCHIFSEKTITKLLISGRSPECSDCLLRFMEQ